jgi:hypothetical protein
MSSTSSKSSGEEVPGSNVSEMSSAAARAVAPEI